MPQTEWRLKGDWIKNCNCAFGCPCDFNARPTHGNCQGLVGMRERVELFGGTLSMTSGAPGRPGGGVVVRATFPLAVPVR